MPEGLSDSRAKCDWADRHIQQIKRTLDEFNNNHACRIKIEEATRNGRHTVSIDASEPLPRDIALAIGDCAHNLRSSLDYAMARCLGVDDGRTSYPVKPEREELLRSKPYQTVRKSNPALADFIVNITEPFEGGRYSIWEVSRINNYDKHKLLIPVFNVRRRENFGVRDRNNNQVIVHKASLGGGSVADLLDTPHSLEVMQAGVVSTDIYFPNDPKLPFVGKPILETLSECRDRIRAAIEALEEFSAGTKPIMLGT